MRLIKLKKKKKEPIDLVKRSGEKRPSVKSRFTRSHEETASRKGIRKIRRFDFSRNIPFFWKREIKNKNRKYNFQKILNSYCY